MVTLPSLTAPVWWRSMHAIWSYHGNRPTNKQTHNRQGRLQYAALQLSAQCNKYITTLLIQLNSVRGYTRVINCIGHVVTPLNAGSWGGVPTRWLSDPLYWWLDVKSDDKLQSLVNVWRLTIRYDQELSITVVKRSPYVFVSLDMSAELTSPMIIRVHYGPV